MNNALVRQQEIILVKRLFDWKLWFRWIFANLISETISLGIMGIAGAIFGLVLANSFNSSSAVTIAFLMIALGIFKGAFVGFTQGKVLRKTLPDLCLQDWIAATIIGTVAALIIAVLPGFLEYFANAQIVKIPEFSVSVSTAVTGFGLGMILGFPQWFVLRRYVENAGSWIFANGLAWSVGLPLLFSGPGVIRAELPAWEIVFYIFAPIVGAGAAAGAIHGLFLVWLLKSKKSENLNQHSKF